jgi:hypothetical protein
MQSEQYGNFYISERSAALAEFESFSYEFWIRKCEQNLKRLTKQKTPLAMIRKTTKWNICDEHFECRMRLCERPCYHCHTNFN